MNNKLGIGSVCPKCTVPMETRQGTNHGKSYFYSQYDYCRFCNHIQHYEKYKVWKAGVKPFNWRDYQVSKIPKTKTAKEIIAQKRAYGVWRRELDQVMKHISS